MMCHRRNGHPTNRNQDTPKWPPVQSGISMACLHRRRSLHEAAAGARVTRRNPVPTPLVCRACGSSRLGACPFLVQPGNHPNRHNKPSPSTAPETANRQTRLAARLSGANPSALANRVRAMPQARRFHRCPRPTHRLPRQRHRAPRGHRRAIAGAYCRDSSAYVT